MLKRDTAETLLQTVIAALETDDQQRIGKAIGALLNYGPLDVRAHVAPADLDDVPTVRAEIVAFLRSIVTVNDRDRASHAIGIDGPASVAARLAGGRVSYVLDGCSWRDAVLLQLLFLLDRVGLRNVRKCQAPDCARVFVKVHKRTFCSSRCQTRIAKRRQVARERQEDEQMNLRRRRQARTMER